MKTRIMLSFAALLGLLSAINYQLSASPLGTAFAYQGKLSAGSGALTGLYDFVFSLWDAPTSGTQLGGSRLFDAVPATNGVFSVTLDFGAGVFTNEARWLEIGVRTNGGGGGYHTLPRQALLPAPQALWAQNAGTAAGVASAAVTGAGIADGQVVKSLNGLSDAVTLMAGANVALATNGNTLQISAATNVGGVGSLLGYKENGPFANGPVATGNNAIAQGEHARALGNHSVVGGGLDNLAGPWFGTTVGGGWSNFAGGLLLGRTTVGGGEANQALGDWSTVGGGQLNTAWGPLWGRATVAGGWQNQALGDMSTISGGSQNSAVIGHAVIGGGQGNTVSNGAWAVIGGGNSNLATNHYATTAGGGHNIAGGSSATVAGGFMNAALAQDSAIGGGYRNNASGVRSVISGGCQNATLGENSTIGGGYNNTASGLYSTAPGGYNNRALGDYSFAGGQSAVAAAPGSMVFADSQAGDFVSTTANEFAVRAAGGVRVESEVGLHLPGPDRPLIVRDWDPFTSNAPNGKAGIGRWGLFMEPNELVLGIPATDVGARRVAVLSYYADGRSNEVFSVGNNGALSLKSPTTGTEVFHVANSGALTLSSPTTGYQMFSVANSGVLTLTSPTTGATLVQLGEGLDYSEGFDVAASAQPPPGTVLVIDAESPGKLAVSRKAYDHMVAGIVAGAQGLGSAVRVASGRFDCDVALAGRVYCNVDASFGAVAPGDLLTTSPTPGYAMRAEDFAKAQGAILGKAMQGVAQGQKGQILVLVTLQ